MLCVFLFIFFFFKQKTAYEMRISDWSSDVCSSDLRLKRLSYLYVRISSPIWAPADILYLAQQAQDGGVYFCPAVMSLLRRAEARDPSLFVALPGEPTGDR